MNAAAVLFNGDGYMIEALGERSMGSVLVLASQPRITRDVRVEDGSEFSRQTMFHAGVPFFEMERRVWVDHHLGW